MKKIKKLLLTILVMSFLLNPMCLILRVHAANEEVAMSRISDTLQSVMKNSQEEMIEVMIWLEDIDTSQEVLFSTERILAKSDIANISRNICEKSLINDSSKVMEKIKEEKSNLYCNISRQFSTIYLFDSELIFSSKYAPMVIAKLTKDRIVELSQLKSIVSITYYDQIQFQNQICFENNERAIDNVATNEVRNDEIGQYIPGKGTYYTVDEIVNYFDIDVLREYTGTLGQGINIGIMDQGYIKTNSPYFYPNSTSDANYPYQLQLVEHYPTYGALQDGINHPTQVLEVLYTILPRANYFYSNCEFREHDYTLYGEVEWLLDNNVKVISCSMSLHWDASHVNCETAETYGNISQYWDFIINEYNVIYVQSAGNPSPDISRGAMTYNGIIVGNYDLGNNCIDESSAYYDGSEWANKPDVCAPGYYYFYSTGNYEAGNSFSAPLVAAVAAMIVNYTNRLMFHGEVKAIICAGTQLHRYSTGTLNIEKYGAGVIDGVNIKQILLNNSSLYSNLGEGTIEKSHIIYLNADISNVVDIILVFECNTGENVVYDIADINVSVYDAYGNFIDGSYSNNSNFEVIRNLQVNTNYYTVVIEENYPAMYDGSSQLTYYSLSWCYK